MASSGPRYAGTGANYNPYGNVLWSNPTYIQGSPDGNVATVYFNGSTNYACFLRATNFGFSIPTGSTINGILVEAYVKCSTTTSSYAWFQIIKGGSETGDYHYKDPGTSYAYLSEGGSTTLWETTWTAEDINASNFGVSWQVRSVYNVMTFYADSIRITVYYTPPPINQTCTDNVNPSDNFSSQTVFVKNFSEDISLFEEFILQSNLNLNVNEDLLLSEEFQYSGIFNKSFSEEASLSDSFSRQAFLNLSFQEEQIINDEFSNRSILNVLFTDDISLNDFVENYPNFVYSIEFLESTFLSEIINTQKAYNNYINDIVIVYDKGITLKRNGRRRIMLKSMNKGEFRKTKMGRMIK